MRDLRPNIRSHIRHHLSSIVGTAMLASGKCPGRY
jgi:hypothetical protein